MVEKISKLHNAVDALENVFNYLEDYFCEIVDGTLLILKITWFTIILILLFAQLNSIFITVAASFLAVMFTHSNMQHYIKGIPWKKTFMYSIF